MLLHGGSAKLRIYSQVFRGIMWFEDSCFTRLRRYSLLVGKFSKHILQLLWNPVSLHPSSEICFFRLQRSCKPSVFTVVSVMWNRIPGDWCDTSALDVLRTCEFYSIWFLLKNLWRGQIFRTGCQSVEVVQTRRTAAISGISAACCTLTAILSRPFVLVTRNPLLKASRQAQAVVTAVSLTVGCSSVGVIKDCWIFYR